MATVTRTVTYEIETKMERKSFADRSIISAEYKSAEMEVVANVWEKNGQKIVYFSHPVAAGASDFIRRKAQIGAYDVRKQEWKSAPTGENKQIANAKAYALRHVSFRDLCKVTADMIELDLTPIAE